MPTARPFLPLASALTLVALLASPGTAQLPGLPVLQNAFSNPGITAALNYGSGDGDRTIAAAAAWAPATGRFQFSAGVGSWTPDEGERATALGARLAMALFSFGGGRFGLAPFVGVGGASVDGNRLTQLPIGAAGGWRGALGATRAISVHAATFYSWTRVDVEEGKAVSDGLVRASGGVDVTLFRSLGLTIGVEGGQNAGEGDHGPRGVVIGGGLSYAFR